MVSRGDPYDLGWMIRASAEATVFPVEFRILPTAADTGYEYGKIIDSTA